MIKVKKRKSKKGIMLKIKHYENELECEAKEIFVGHRTIFSLLGFTVSGILVGRSLWQYSSTLLGLPMTILIGFALFVLSGVALSEFND